MKRKFLSLFLLFCVSCDPLVGTFTWLHYKKAAVKKEAKRKIDAGIDEDSLVVLKFSKEEAQTKLRWEHPQEFEYNRQMYDVVKTTICDGTIYYWCRPDDEETTLIGKLEKLAGKALGKSANSMVNLALLMSYFKSVYGTFPFRWSVPEPRLLGKPFSIFYGLYPTIFIRPPTPPPRFK